MLQNAAPLRKSTPGPPNISDEHVSCTAPATRNASFQILIQRPTPAIVFGNATKPSRFAHFRCRIPCACHAKPHLNFQKVIRACGAFNILTWKRASRHHSVHFFDISTSKNASKLVCFVDFDFDMCFAPQWRNLFVM